MPPIWMAIDEKFAKPHSAYVAITKLRGSRLDPTPGSPSFDERDELVEHHARAEEVADGQAVLPRHAHRPRDRTEDPAEDDVEAGRGTRPAPDRARSRRCR